MTNFERKKKNGALDALRGHHTGRLAGILADIGSVLVAVQFLRARVPRIRWFVKSD
jgi:hypothetical protein